MNCPPVSAGIPNPGVNVKSLQPVFVLSSKLSTTRAKARQSPDNQAMTPETNRNRPTRGEYLVLIRREVSWNCQSYDRSCTESQTVCRLAANGLTFGAASVIRLAIPTDFTSYEHQIFPTCRPVPVCFRRHCLVIG